MSHEKHNKELHDDAVEAKALGLSYGVYSAYKASGYLEKYKADKHVKTEGKTSALGGCGAKHKYSLEARKLS